MKLMRIILFFIGVAILAFLIWLGINLWDWFSAAL